MKCHTRLCVGLEKRIAGQDKTKTKKTCARKWLLRLEGANIPGQEAAFQRQGKRSAPLPKLSLTLIPKISYKAEELHIIVETSSRYIYI